MNGNSHIEKENAVLKQAASLLPKWKIDIVAQFADSKEIYAMHYFPVSDEWLFTDGEIYSTFILLGGDMQYGGKSTNAYKFPTSSRNLGD